MSRTLTDQHERGRQITDYIAAIARKGRIRTADTTPLANALTGLVRMYEHHAAIEDTVVFPAWKKAIPEAQYRELVITRANGADIVVCGRGAGRRPATEAVIADLLELRFAWLAHARAARAGAEPSR